MWDEKGMFKVTEQRLADQADQARTILKSNLFTMVELKEIKRNVDGDEQRMSSTTEFASAGTGNEVLNKTMEEVDSSSSIEGYLKAEENRIASDCRSGRFNTNKGHYGDQDCFMLVLW